MNGEQLRDAIAELIDAHPDLSPSKVGQLGKLAHAWIYVTKDGQPLAIEPERKQFQNIWVRADSVNIRRLTGIRSEHYDHRTFDVSKPNHNLFGEPTFKDCDLICFKVVNVWQAVRVLAEVAGPGRPL